MANRNRGRRVHPVASASKIINEGRGRSAHGALYVLKADNGQHLIRGAHLVLYSPDADADRAFFRDVFTCPAVDAGHGWLIFALPPAELAIHPAEANGAHELFLMCEDVQAFIAQMAERDIVCSGGEPRTVGIDYGCHAARRWVGAGV